MAGDTVGGAGAGNTVGFVPPPLPGELPSVPPGANSAAFHVVHLAATGQNDYFLTPEQKKTYDQIQSLRAEGEFVAAAALEAKLAQDLYNVEGNSSDPGRDFNPYDNTSLGVQLGIPEGGEDGVEKLSLAVKNTRKEVIDFVLGLDPAGAGTADRIVSILEQAGLLHAGEITALNEAKAIAEAGGGERSRDYGTAKYELTLGYALHRISSEFEGDFSISQKGETDAFLVDYLAAVFERNPIVSNSLMVEFLIDPSVLSNNDSLTFTNQMRTMAQDFKSLFELARQAAIQS